MSDRDEHDEPLSLDEARAARRLAEALDGTCEPDAALEAELRAAARVASTAPPGLSEARRDEIADELFGAVAPVRRGRRSSRRAWMALAASIAVVTGIGVLGRRGSEAPRSSSRQAASELVAALLPAPTAAQRADLIAREARARVPGASP